MPWQAIRFDRVSDDRVLRFFEDVMAAWPTNDAIMAAGGVSHILGSGGLDGVLRDKRGFRVTSASVSERIGLFTIYFRRNADDSGLDEISLFTREEEPFVGEEDVKALDAMMRRLVPSSA